MFAKSAWGGWEWECSVVEVNLVLYCNVTVVMMRACLTCLTCLTGITCITNVFFVHTKVHT